MNDNAIEVKEDPARADSALAMAQANPLLLEGLVNLLRDGIYLTFRFAGADNKVVGEGANLTSI